jgi:hypothetical protein
MYAAEAAFSISLMAALIDLTFSSAALMTSSWSLMIIYCCLIFSSCFSMLSYISISIRTLPPVGVKIRDAILVFNVLYLEGHLEPNCHFTFLNIP